MRSELRLRRSSDFSRVRAARRSWAHPLLVCYVALSAEGDQSRVGMVVGRRIGNAVVRNRVKRRIREGVRALDLRSGRDIVLVARPGAAGASSVEIQQALAELAGRAGLLREGGSAGGDK